MAKKSQTYTEPDDDELAIEPPAEKPEPDEPQYMETPEQDAVVTPMANNQQQVDTHTAAVTAAKGTIQSTVAASLTAYKAGTITAAVNAANVKNANIAYYQSVLSSGQTNGMPVPGAIEALRTLGAM